jgi:predicted dehydrogenase
VEHIREGSPPRETYADGYAVSCILDAGYESARRGRWVKVKY